jgi:hypothetical protein
MSEAPPCHGRFQAIHPLFLQHIDFPPGGIVLEREAHWIAHENQHLDNPGVCGDDEKIGYQLFRC